MPEEKNSEHPGLSDSMRMEPVAFASTLPASRRKRGKLLAHCFRFLEFLTVVVTCIFLLDQTNELRKQTKQNSLTTNLQVALFLRDHYQTINKILAEEEEARTAFGLKIEQVLAYMLISDYDIIYQMHHEKLINDTKWKILDPFIRQTMTDDKLKIRDLWNIPGNRGRSPEFREYVDACVYSHDQDPTIEPANPQVIGMVKANIIPNDRRIDAQYRLCPEKVFY